MMTEPTVSPSASGAAGGAILVMGVSGVGKSTIAALLAERLGWTYADADQFHPPANVAKMRAGLPLDDRDRQPWLDRLAAFLGASRQEGRRVVLACSALKRAYRDRLRAGREDLRLVYLQGGRDLIARRMAARVGHFMPVGQLDDQLEVLEEPQPDEHAVVVSSAAAPNAIVAVILARLAPLTA